MQKLITNIWKKYDKNKELSYLKYWNVNNLGGREISQKLPVNNFEWIEDTSQFNENFKKIYNKEYDEGYFIEAEVQYLEKLNELDNDLPIFPDRMKTEKVEKLATNLYDKTKYVIHIGN